MKMLRTIDIDMRPISAPWPGMNLRVYVSVKRAVNMWELTEESAWSDT